MKKDKKQQVPVKTDQTGKAIKKGLPIKNKMTDRVMNRASQSNGLNQSKVVRDDLFPSDGDNLTN